MRAGTEKTELRKVVAKVCQQSEQRIVRLNVELVGRKRTKKLTRFLITESVNAVDAVVLQLRHDAANGL